jgi:hypothetical protein
MFVCMYMYNVSIYIHIYINIFIYTFIHIFVFSQDLVAINTSKVQIERYGIKRNIWVVNARLC